MKLWVLLIILGMSMSALAESLSDYSRSVRTRGMGGVRLPFVREADALFFNPAALGFIPSLDIKLIDFQLGTTSDTISNMATFATLNPSDANTYSSLFDKKLSAQASAKTAFAMGKIAFGYLQNAEFSTVLQYPLFPVFETYFLQDEAYYLGAAIPLGSSAYVGFNFKKMNRWGGFSKSLTIVDLQGIKTIQDVGNKFTDKGTAYGADISLMAELPTPIKPSVAIVLEDIGGTRFTKTQGSDAPPSIPQNLSMGSGLIIDLPGLDVSAGGELRHLLDSDYTVEEKIHLGAEVSLPFIDFRAGIHKGYMSYGAGFHFLIFHLDAASYQEEVGVYPARAGEAHYMVSLSIDLSFDAAFKFTDNAGQRRKLKQRR